MLGEVEKAHEEIQASITGGRWAPSRRQDQLIISHDFS
jgi:hypothetical protein